MGWHVAVGAANAAGLWGCKFYAWSKPGCRAQHTERSHSHCHLPAAAQLSFLLLAFSFCGERRVSSGDMCCAGLLSPSELPGAHGWRQLEL